MPFFFLPLFERETGDLTLREVARVGQFNRKLLLVFSIIVDQLDSCAAVPSDIRNS